MMLSPTNRANIARVVTGLRCTIYERDCVLIYQKDGSCSVWNLDVAWMWKCTVEWLADRIKAINTTEDRLVFYALTFIEALTERDASKLEQLVFELMGNP